jgi:hypothetical protein
MQVSWADDGSVLANTTVQSNGTFTVSFKVPSNAGQGGHTIYFTDLASRYLLTAVFTVTSSTPTVTVERAFTRDGNGNEKSSFAPGDAIQYAEVLNNSNSSSVTATFDIQVTNPSRSVIFSDHWNMTLPGGVVGVYTPSTVPTNAAAGTYNFKVTVTYNGMSSSGQSQFTIMLISILNSSNYAGYGTVGSVYSRVRAYWTVPTAVCEGLRATAVAPWVGLGGLEGGQYIEQTGTESACLANGTQIVPTYFAWYELLPAAPQRLDNYVVKANDAMAATVAYGGISNGRGVFAFQLVDYTQHWTYYTTQLGPAEAIARSSAEWIVEAPGIGPISTGTLTKFSSPIEFTGCYVDDKSITTRGLTVEKFMMVIKHPKGPRADTSDLGNDGTAFSVTWRHY